jgi:hypothetical protein
MLIEFAGQDTFGCVLKPWPDLMDLPSISGKALHDSAAQEITDNANSCPKRILSPHSICVELGRYVDENRVNQEPRLSNSAEPLTLVPARNQPYRTIRKPLFSQRAKTPPLAAQSRPVPWQLRLLHPAS